MAKLSKRLVASLGMVLSAALVFTACGSNSGDSTASSTAGESSAAATATVEKVHKLKVMGKSKFNAYVKWDDRTKFASWKLYEEQLKARNIELEYEFVVPEQYATVVQTRLAAAVSLPDIIAATDTELDDMTALNLGKSGTIIEIGDAIAQYSDGTINAAYEKRLGFSKQATTTADGKRYWFPTAIAWSNLLDGTGKEVSNYGVIGTSIRKDWLDKLSLPMPQTVDDWKAALKAFRDKDVNGSGAKDEVIIFDNYSYSFFTGIAQWFGLVPDIAAYDPLTKTVTSPWYQPGVKDYFKLMNELAKEGIFDVGMVGAKDEAVDQKIAENKVSGKRGYAVDSYSEGLIKGVDEAEYMLLPNLSGGSGITPLMIVETSDTISYDKFMITKECKDVEGAIKLFDYLFSDEYAYVRNYGVEGQDYKMVDGKPEKIEPTLTQEEIYNKTRGSLGFFVGNFFPRIEGLVTMKQKTVQETLDQSANDKVRRGQSRRFELLSYENKVTSPYSAKRYALPNEEENEINNKYMTALKTYSEELSMSLILGNESIDNWDAHIKKLQELGLDEIIKVNKARYERYVAASK